MISKLVEEKECWRKETYKEDEGGSWKLKELRAVKKYPQVKMWEKQQQQQRKVLSEEFISTDFRFPSRLEIC